MKDLNKLTSNNIYYYVSCLLITFANIFDPCADPGIFARGVQGRLPKTALTTFFCYSSTYFTVLQRVSNGYFKENYNFLRFQGGGGSNIFQGGGGSKS